MESLLQKTRRVNKTLQSYGSKPVSFTELSRILSDVLDANIYIVSRKGRVLGYALTGEDDKEIEDSQIVKERKFPKKFNDELMKIYETKENIIMDTSYVLDKSFKGELPDKITTVIPINSGGARLGTLVLTRSDRDFLEEDLVLAEYSATIVGMEILRATNEEVEEEARKISVVQMAIGTLSYSELEAMNHIFNELDGNEGLLVASKIADRVGITRSVIVNALRKFESAGVVESRSLGMKGTHIKILNDKLLDELKKARG